MNHHQGSINSSQLPLLLPSSCRYLNGYADGSGPPALTDDLVDAIKNNAIGIKLHKCNVNANELSSELVAEMSENALGGPVDLLVRIPECCRGNNRDDAIDKDNTCPA